MHFLGNTTMIQQTVTVTRQCIVRCHYMISESPTLSNRTQKVSRQSTSDVFCQQVFNILQPTHYLDTFVLLGGFTVFRNHT